MPALNQADGQLAASTATILGVGTAERTVGIALFNTAAQTQTVILTLTRTGGTARSIARAELKENEALYVDGIQMDPSDVLSGYASGASSVDYLVSLSSKPFGITTRDATGVAKASQAITLTIPTSTDLDAGQVEMVGILEEIRDVLLKIA